MILSIIFYVLLAITLSTLGKMEWVATNRYYLKTGVYRTNWTVNTLLLLTIFIVACGLRYRTGVDCESYVETLRTGRPQDTREEFELFFAGIVQVLHSLDASRFVFLGILAALEIVPFYYALKSRKNLYQYVGLLLILGPFFMFWMNGIRQSIAACIFVLAISYNIEGGNRNKLIAACIIIIAAQFHTSAYALLVFLFIPNLDYFKNRYINIAILLLCAVIGQTDYMNNFLGRFNVVEQDSAYDLYLRHFEDFLDADAAMDYGPRRIVLLIANLIALWYAPKMKEKFKTDSLFLFSFNIFFIHACLNDNLFSNVHYIFRRPFFYTQPFQMICFAYLLYYLDKCNKVKNKDLIFYGTLLFSCTYMIIECLATGGSSNETSLYKLYMGQ